MVMFKAMVHNKEQGCMRVMDAKQNAKHAGHNAKQAAIAQEEWTAKEAKLQEKAKETGAEMEALKKQADTDNKEEEEKLEKDGEEAAKKIAAAAEDTHKAEAAKKKADADYEAYKKELEKEGKLADEASKARLEEYEKAMKDASEAIEHEKAEQEKIAKDSAAAAEKLKEEHAAEEAKLEGEEKEIADKLKKDEKEMADEKKASDEKYAAEDKSNKEKADRKMEELKAEKEKNDEEAAAEQKKIKEDYEKKKEAEEAEKKAWDKKAAADAAVVAAGRGKKAAEAQEKANAAEEEYEAKMGVADKMQEDADEADKAYEDSLTKSKEEAAAEKAETEQEEKSDSEVVNCGDDACVGKDGKCHDTDDEKGPWLAEKDLVSCTDKKDEAADMDSNNNALKDWIHMADAPTLAPLPKPTQACKDSMEALPEAVKAAFAAHDSDPAKCPLVELACDAAHGGSRTTTSKAELKGYLVKFFETAALCPPICYPGSATTTDDGVADTHGICTTSAMLEQMKQQFEGSPIYEASGTNDRFKAGNDADDLCTDVLAINEGIGAGIKTA